MHDLLSKINIKVNKAIYLKDPESSELGRSIISNSIELLDELGFESFTIGKLAKRINSTEASIYRYFISKHKLLLYLISWYWGWMEYRLVFGLANIKSPLDRLEKAINLLTSLTEEDGDFSHINELKLNRIVIAESPKTYLTREVDNENKEGVYSGYKLLVERISEIILEINPKYKYSHMLVSTLIEGTHFQRYFEKHLPRLTNVVSDEDSVQVFYKELVFKAIS